jgi:hypothetical protein
MDPQVSAAIISALVGAFAGALLTDFSNAASNRAKEQRDAAIRQQERDQREADRKRGEDRALAAAKAAEKRTVLMAHAVPLIQFFGKTLNRSSEKLYLQDRIARSELMHEWPQKPRELVILGTEDGPRRAIDQRMVAYLSALESSAQGITPQEQLDVLRRDARDEAARFTKSLGFV